MKLARSRRRTICALAGLAAAACAAPALAYDDKSTVGAVMDLVGVSTDPSAKSIDYGERPKLVLPPRVGDLPSPRENAERPGGWPSDPAAAAGRRDTNRYARVPNAAPEEQKPGLLERALGVGSRTSGPVMDEPNRHLLTEPPPGYRRPTKDLSTIRDTDAKKGSWWNPLSYIGASGGDDGPVNPAAPDTRGGGRPASGRTTASGASAAAPDSRASDGLLSGLRMPSFFRGSDDN